MKQQHAVCFSQAMTRLTLKQDAVFFISLLYSLAVQRDDTMPAPAATDGKTIIYNEPAFAEYSVDDRVFILVHEIWHVVLFHNTRRGSRAVMIQTQDGRTISLWNIACDYVVNGMIASYGWKVPANGIQPRAEFKDLSAEQVYDLLLKDVKPDPSPSSGGDDPRPLSGHDLSGAHTDVLDHQPGKPGADGSMQTKAELEREIGMATEKAAQTAKAAGSMSQALKDKLSAAQVVKEPWYSHLRRYVTVMNTRAYNWSKINVRRMVTCGVVFPDSKSESMGKLMVSIDESGSLRSSQLAAIAAHVSDVCRMCNPKSVVILRHTDRVTHSETFEGPDYAFALERKSMGGTDFRPVFEFVEAEHPDTQVILMFTDMEGPMPQTCAHDVVWVTSTPQRAPFGEIIEADFND